MQSLLVVKDKILLQIASGLGHCIIVFEIDFFILHRSPEPLYKDVVKSVSSAITADADLSDL